MKEIKDFLNKIICDDCLNILRKLPDNCIDLVVTSPPYIDRRKEYNSVPEEEYVEWFFEISQEIMRVLKSDGSFVLNIKEGTRKTGVKETYILEYVLKMAKVYRWNESFIWDKIQPMPVGTKNRLKDGWEYCFQFTNSKEYKFYVDQYIRFNRDGLKRNITKNTIMGGVTIKNEAFKRPSNVFSFHTSTISRKQVDHPAMYPKELPRIFITLMTKPGDIVLDPFSGSGTTALVAYTLARKYIGIDMSEKYCKIARKRVNKDNMLKVFNGEIV
jgi:DNA modification methylase